MSKEKTTCLDCGEEYQRISQHINMSDCEWYEIDEKTMDILKGILMGDGSVQKSNEQANPRFRVTNTNSVFISWLEERLGRLHSSTGFIEAERVAENLGSDESKVKGKHHLETITHEKFEELESWYSSGEKIFPKNLELNPTILKMWYACDGYFTKDERIGIACANEIGNEEKLKSYFKEENLPEPKIYKQEHENGTNLDLAWTVEESKELFGYMGEKVAGFSYKFRKEISDTRFAALWKRTDGSQSDSDGITMDRSCSDCNASLRRTERLRGHPNYPNRMYFIAVVECDCSEYKLGETSELKTNLPDGWTLD